LLKGLYEDVPPLQSCEASGMYVPCSDMIIEFPMPSAKQTWKKLSMNRKKCGQYVTYVNNVPLPMTIIPLSEITSRPHARTVFCMINGTHSFECSSLEGVVEELKNQDMDYFSEYTDTIFQTIKKTLSRSVYKRAIDVILAAS
jgi:hypothetical protein